jgi:hypothetical protein
MLSIAVLAAILHRETEPGGSYCAGAWPFGCSLNDSTAPYRLEFDSQTQTRWRGGWVRGSRTSFGCFGHSVHCSTHKW